MIRLLVNNYSREELISLKKALEFPICDEFTKEKSQCPDCPKYRVCLDLAQACLYLETELLKFRTEK